MFFDSFHSCCCCYCRAECAVYCVIDICNRRCLQSDEFLIAWSLRHNDWAHSIKINVKMTILLFYFKICFLFFLRIGFDFEWCTRDISKTRQTRLRPVDCIIIIVFSLQTNWLFLSYEFRDWNGKNKRRNRNAFQFFFLHFRGKRRNSNGTFCVLILTNESNNERTRKPNKKRTTALTYRRLVCLKVIDTRCTPKQWQIEVRAPTNERTQRMYKSIQHTQTQTLIRVQRAYVWRSVVPWLFMKSVALSRL